MMFRASETDRASRSSLVTTKVSSARTAARSVPTGPRSVGALCCWHEDHESPSGAASSASGTEQPSYSILNRGVKPHVLPDPERYEMGTIVWSPLAQGLLTGRVRKGQQSDLRRSGAYSPTSVTSAASTSWSSSSRSRTKPACR